MVEERKYPAWSIDGKTEGVFGTKPMLNVGEQIAKLENKGITFKRCGKEEAAEALSRNETYLHLTAYSKLFQKHSEGPYARKFVNLDFADLLDLDVLDAKLRAVVKRLAEDIERGTKTKIVRKACEMEGCDGYSILRDFVASLPADYRRNLEHDLAHRSDPGNDPYRGPLIQHYRDAMPLWVFVEVVSFGALLALYLYCARRWSDGTMRNDHYALKFVKSIRNCVSHGSCIINSFHGAAHSERTTPLSTIEWLSEHGIAKSNARTAKLKNPAIQQIATTIALFDESARASASSQTTVELQGFGLELQNRTERYGTQNAFVSYFSFLGKIIDAAS